MSYKCMIFFLSVYRLRLPFLSFSFFLSFFLSLIGNNWFGMNVTEVEYIKAKKKKKKKKKKSEAGFCSLICALSQLIQCDLPVVAQLFLFHNVWYHFSFKWPVLSRFVITSLRKEGVGHVTNILAICSDWRSSYSFFFFLLLTHCRLNKLSHTIYGKSPTSVFGTSGYEI